MASITITAGATTSTKTASNATVSAMLDDYIVAKLATQFGAVAPVTAQEKADFVLNSLVRYFVETANSQAIRTAADAAATTEAATVRTRDWV